MSIPPQSQDGIQSAGSFELMSKEELRQILPSLCHPEELQAAVYELAKSMNPSDQDVDLFLQVLSAAQEEKLISTLLWAIALRQDRLPVSMVASYLTDSRPSVRTAAVRALGTHPQAMPHLFQVAQRDEEPTLRKEAIWWLTVKSDSSLTEEVCLGEYRREQEPSVKGRWLILMGTLNTAKGREALLEIIRSPGEPIAVRRDAVEALVFSRDSQLLAAVGQNFALPEPVRSLAIQRAEQLIKPSDPELNRG